ncbi:unnamed protein product [Ascophyllum nodosum]
MMPLQQAEQEEQPTRRQHRHQQQQQQQRSDGEYFDLNVLKGAVCFDTKPFKHRALVWIGFRKVLLFPFCWSWWLSRISRTRFLVGCALYTLHNLCTWLYIRGCLSRYSSQSPTWSSSGCRVVQDMRVTQVEIFLPYVIAALFGIGYGSVVAAERVSPARRRVSSLRSSGDGVKCGRGISSASRKSGGGGSSGDDCSSSAGSDRSGARNIDQLSFADQVRARDSRDEAGAHTSADDDDDYDDDDDDNDEAVLSGGGSDNESPTVERRSERVPTVSAASSGNRQLAKERGADSSSDNGKDDRGSSGSCDGVRTNHRMSTPGACDAAEIEQPSSRPLAVGSPNTDGVDTEETDDVGISGRGSVSNNVAERNGARGVEDGVTNRDRGTSVDPSVDVGIFRQRGFSSADGDDDEEEDEDSGGWGQVIVNPVKVARWDERGKRSKTALSLNQLRTLIIERAESAPQEATYRRATKLGILATVFLPALFTLFVIAARAWVDALPEDAEPQAGEDISSPSLDFLPPFQPASASQELAPPSGYASCDAEADRAAACDGIKLETLAFVALCRAARAGWALVLRALRPETGDGAAVAVTVTSLCSVAFIALPVFRALEDAERTYQRRYMYSKFFGALTSSQRARKHRLPYFSLKNVANIRVWLALRLGKTWLRRHRRERSADAVVSLAFYLSLALLAAILFEVLGNREARFLTMLVHWELLVWCCSISFFLLRYLTLGADTNDRYRDTSVLLTEQINVQLRILQSSANRDSNKAGKRERLAVSSKVLDLATKLLKELDGPNKLSGLSMNPLLYNVTRAVLVSALSGVMSDTLGFSVKLYKVLSPK